MKYLFQKNNPYCNNRLGFRDLSKHEDVLCKECGTLFNKRKKVTDQKFCSMECCAKYRSEHIEEFGNFKGKHHTVGAKAKQAMAHKGKQLSKEHIQHLIKAAQNRPIEIIKRILGKRGKSKLESKFESIINKYNLPYKFVGDGKFHIERKIPDFINTNGEKIAIEVYYRRHKEEFRGGLDRWKENRTIIFNNYGWKLLFFDETMVEDSIINKTLRGGVNENY